VADTIVVVHFGFVLFVALGGLLVLYRGWIAWIHLPAAAWGVLIEFTGWICPLTPLEQDLRRAAGAASYAESFTEHYILPLLYPIGLTRPTQMALGFAVLALNAAIYGFALYRQARKRKAPGPKTMERAEPWQPIS
jgi:uncharacterized protein DUF2784